MKIVLIYPYEKKCYSGCNPPISLLYLAASLLKNNYEIPTVFSDEPIVKSDECEADTRGGGLNCDGYGSSLNITAAMAFYVVAYIFSRI